MTYGTTSPFPAFETPEWSAAFDSHDQYRDDAYYVVTLRADGHRFIAQVDVAALRDDATAGERADHLRAALAEVAATGRTNTTYSP